MGLPAIGGALGAFGFCRSTLTSSTSVACSCLGRPKTTAGGLQLTATTIRRFGFQVLVAVALRAADSKRSIVT